MMTQKQAAVLITLSTIVQRQLDSSNPLRALLQSMTDEMCDELDRFGMLAPDQDYLHAMASVRDALEKKR